MTTANLVSLDIETTGLTADDRITEIAVVHAGSGMAIQKWLDVPAHCCWAQWSEEQIRPAWSTREHSSPAGVDRLLCAAFEAWGLERGKVILAGFNVGSFDRRFVDSQLPGVAEWCAYRHLDLTAIRILLDEVAPVDHPEGWAGRYLDLATEALGEANEHDALWDARAGLVLWEHALAVTTTGEGTP